MGELLGADTDALDRVASSMSIAAQAVHGIGILAQRAMAELNGSWNGPDLLHLTRQWERAVPQLAGASALLDACAAQLRAQSAAQKDASSDGGRGVGHLLAGMAGLARMPTAPPASPPRGGSPAENASWWRSLSPQHQQQVIKEHPRWIGNRDGVAFMARDQANRALLTVDRGRLEAERRHVQADLAGTAFGGAITTGDAALDHVTDKMAALDAIGRTLARAGDRQLLVLDLAAGRVEAAIARGDVDTADNVAVFVPGVSANVADSMEAYDTSMDQLQRRAELESRRANAGQSAATVAWIGYQAPQKGVLVGNVSMADDHAAKRGAARLVPFLQGIGAARSHDAHLSLLGHSYGSTTAGLALRHDTGVDDAVFFGSPGIGTSHVEDLKLAAGHAYYIEARQDVVGDLGYFGIDPSHLAGIEHASARGSTVVDPLTGEIRHLREVTGHSSYLGDDSASQYNMSVVVAGVPDRRVYDRGAGMGDVLSWPIPGTYR